MMSSTPARSAAPSMERRVDLTQLTSFVLFKRRRVTALASRLAQSRPFRTSRQQAASGAPHAALPQIEAAGRFRKAGEAAAPVDPLQAERIGSSLVEARDGGHRQSVAGA